MCGVVSEAREAVFNIVLEHGFSDEAIRQIKALNYIFYLNTSGHYKWFTKRFAKLFVTHLMRVISGKERVPEFMKDPPHTYLEHFYNTNHHPEVNSTNLRLWLIDQYGPAGQIGSDGIPLKKMEFVHGLMAPWIDSETGIGQRPRYP